MHRVFDGKLTLDHMGCHVPHRFEVPEGTGTLRLKFASSPRHPGVGNIAHQLSISVYGPNGARGTRHNNADQSPIISRNWASPGYLPGEIEAGEWTVEIDVHRILPPGNVSYSIEVTCDDAEIEAPAAEPMPDPPAPQKRRGPGWYTGDFHGHTLHSDGNYSPAEYLQVAHQRGYDFVSLTDHNTISGVPHLLRLAGDGMTVIGGVELTTYNGHALVLGLDDWVEWRVKDGTTMSGIARDAQDRGGLYVIAHPKSEGHPFCTGCRWAYSDMLPGPARHVEIWNHAWTERSHNEGAVQLFYQWLNTGLRMVATAGTDTHRPDPAGCRIAANRVYAEDNTGPAILAAIGRGHSYVTSGPDLMLQAETVAATTARMGDIVEPGPLKLTCASRKGGNSYDMTDLHLRLIRRGVEIAHWPANHDLEATVEAEAEPGAWYVLELRDQSHGLHGLTNPIFVGAEGDPWH